MKTLKECAKCGESKSIEHFHKAPDTRDGYQRRCKSCRNLERKAQYQKIKQAKPPRVLKDKALIIEGRKRRSAAWAKNNPDKIYRSVKAYRERNPEKIRVHRTIANNKTYGKLKKKPCVVCGNDKTDAHHDDYNKPLEVTFLCRKHHKAWHRVFIPEGIQNAHS